MKFREKAAGLRAGVLHSQRRVLLLPALFPIEFDKLPAPVSSRRRRVWILSTSADTFKIRIFTCCIVPEDDAADRPDDLLDFTRDSITRGAGVFDRL